MSSNFPLESQNSGIPSNYVPVVAHDTEDNCGNLCIGLYFNGDGQVTALLEGGGTQTAVFQVVASQFLPGQFKRVMITDTDAALRNDNMILAVQA